MADESFLPGVNTLINSVIRNSGYEKDEIEFVILNLGGVRNDNIKPNVDVDIWDANELGQFQFDESLLNNKKKRVNQNKFLIFKLPYDEVMCYVDADQLCLGDITELESFDPITAGINIGRAHPETVKNRLMFNSGLFLFRPSNELYDGIQSFALNYQKKISYGDQRIMNEYFYEHHANQVDLLGLEWNVAVSLKRHHPRLWRYAKNQGIKFLHYTAGKPWEPRSGLKAEVKRLIWYREPIRLWKKNSPK